MLCGLLAAAARPDGGDIFEVQEPTRDKTQTRLINVKIQTWLWFFTRKKNNWSSVWLVGFQNVKSYRQVLSCIGVISVWCCFWKTCFWTHWQTDTKNAQDTWMLHMINNLSKWIVLQELFLLLNSWSGCEPLQIILNNKLFIQVAIHESDRIQDSGYRI